MTVEKLLQLKDELDVKESMLDNYSDKLKPEVKHDFEKRIRFLTKVYGFRKPTRY